MINNEEKLKEVKQINSQVLAFMGDAVFSLYVKEKIVTYNRFKSGVLTSLSNKMVNAKSQSLFLAKIKDLLTLEELEIVNRAKNYKTKNNTKSSSLEEYKNSTALEALIGFLYLEKKFDRLYEILDMLEF